MRTLSVQQNIPAYHTKLMPSFCINFISPPLVMDKLIQVNSRAITSPPKMRVLFEVERTPAVTIKSRLILVMHTDHYSQNKTFNQQRKIHIQSLNWTVLQILRQGSTYTAVQLTRCFRSTLLLTHKVGIACAIEIDAESNE